METTHERTAPLVPRTVLPERYSARAEMVLWLKRIDHVHVREAIQTAHGTRYVVDVYMRLSQSHIPTHRLQPSSQRRPNGPDMTVKRPFGAFTKLLSDFYDLAHAGHGFLPCPFCVAFVDYMLARKPAPSVIYKWFHTDASVCALLTQYLNNLLALTCRVKTYDDSCHNCVGKQQVPQRMKAFFTPEEEQEERNSRV